MGKLYQIAVSTCFIRVLACLELLLVAPRCDAKPDGELIVEIVDSQSGKPVASRIHLRDSRGRLVRARGWGSGELAEHAYLDGATKLGLKRGAYRFDLDPGPEYRTLTGHFEIDRDANDNKKIEVHRFANLAEEGWYAADVGILRKPSDHELLQKAEQLNFLANLGWLNKTAGWEPAGRIAKGRQPAAGSSALWSDDRGIIWLHDPTGMLTAKALPKPSENQIDFLTEARANGWVIVVSATSWELPLWIAHDLVDALLVMDGLSDSKAGVSATRMGRPPTERRFQNKTGIARWRETIYHQLLESGICLPPVALSGSGLNDHPVGSARIYFHSDKEPHKSAVWKYLLSANTVMTNGPLLRPIVEGSPPGIELASDFPREVQIGLNLATRTPVDYLEIIQNGEIAKSVRLMDWASAGGKLPPIIFDKPGWFLIRAVTNEQQEYQFASTAPYYVGKRGERIRSKATQFFLDWLDEYKEKFKAADLVSYQKSVAFWQRRQKNATVD